MSEINRCLVCGSEDLAEHFDAVDCLVSREKFRVMKCSDCGFIFTANPPDESKIGVYYLSEDYISHSDRKKSITEVLYHLARRFMLGKKARLVARVCRIKKGTLLDIGSGTGYFASFMKDKGWEVKGVEISDKATIFSKSQFGIDVIPPDSVGNLQNQSFDCITLWHVLEHFYDPDYWMGEIDRLLSDRGICILALPNITSADSKWFGRNWAALDVPRHLWHFSPVTLNNFINRAGFTCTMVKSMPLDSYYISILSYKNRRSAFAFIRGIATGLFLSTRNIFVRNSSSSLIYILEKRGA